MYVLVLDPGITHPVYPPGTTLPIPVPGTTYPLTHGPATMFVPGDSQFGHLVGEPRGSRTQPVLTSRTGNNDVLEVNAGSHGRLTGFMTVFTEFY